MTFGDDRLPGDALKFTFDAAFVDPEIGENKTVLIENIVINSGADQGNYVLATTGGQATAEIRSGAPESMVVTQEPGPSVAGQPVPAAELKLFDAHGFPVRAGFGVTAKLNGGEFTGSSATTAYTDESGTVVFDDLVISRADTGYTLTFSVDAAD